MNNQIPKGWTIAKFEDLLDYIQPTNYIVKSTDYKETYPTPVLTAGKSFIKGYTNETEGIFTELPTIIFDDFTTATQYVNFPFKVKSSAMKILQPTCDLVNIKLAYYFMQTIHLKGETHKRFWISEYSQLPVQLAPLKEQKRIIDKIEELITDLDKGIEYLETTKQQLKVYRQSVLNRAFEGKFTKEWRKNNHSKTGDSILEEIKSLRDKTLNENFKNGDKESKRILSKVKKHTFKTPTNTSIPQEWAWSSLMNASYLVVDCHNKTAPYVKEGIYLIRTTNVRDGKLILDNEIRFVSEETYKYWSRRCPPEPGDILFTREAPMGEVAIIPPNTKVCMGQRIMLLRTFKKYLLPKYLHYATLEPLFQQRMRKNAIGTGVKHLRVGDVEELTFPICSIEEQRQVISEIETRLSVCDKIEETIESSLQQAEALRLSIIKKAFEGKLVQQDPNDEPAEKLLERIRALRQTKGMKGKGKPKKKEKETKTKKSSKLKHATI